MRPHLEHAAPARYPYLAKDINSLESVQRFAMKVCLKQWNTPYCQLLNQSRLPDPNTCHKHLNLCNIVNGIHVYPNLPLVSYSPQHMLQNTHSYMQFSAHTNYFQHYFFPYETPYLVILLLHQLFLFLRIIFIPYSFFMGACITCCTLTIHVSFHCA